MLLPFTRTSHTPILIDQQPNGKPSHWNSRFLRLCDENNSIRPYQFKQTMMWAADNFSLPTRFPTAGRNTMLRSLEILSSEWRSEHAMWTKWKHYQLSYLERQNYVMKMEHHDDKWIANEETMSSTLERIVFVSILDSILIIYCSEQHWLTNGVK